MTLREKWPKGFKSLSEANKELMGKTFRMTNNAAGLAVGSDITITYVNGATTANWYMTGRGPGNNGGYNIYPQEVEASPMTIDEIKKSNDRAKERMKEIELEIETNNSRISFMEEQGLKEYDENVFKTFEILKTIDKKSSNIDKAKKIVQILKG